MVVCPWILLYLLFENIEYICLSIISSIFHKTSER